MAKTQEVAILPTNNVSLFDDSGWETQTEGARIKVEFETYGDCFIGIKEGSELITDPNLNDDGEHNTWMQYNFKGVATRDADGTIGTEVQDEPCAIAPGYELLKTLEAIPNGMLCRITYVREVDLGKTKNPMRSFKVDTRKP